MKKIFILIALLILTGCVSETPVVEAPIEEIKPPLESENTEVDTEIKEPEMEDNIKEPTEEDIIAAIDMSL